METTTDVNVCTWRYGSCTGTDAVTNYVSNQLSGTGFDVDKVAGSFRDALSFALPGGISLNGETFEIFASLNYLNALWDIFGAVKSVSVLDIAMTFHSER